MVDFKMIVACDRDWGIGKSGQLLTHLSGDLKYFKEKTLSGLVILGRKTAATFPGGRALPCRVNLMLSTTEDARDGYIIEKNVKAVIARAEALTAAHEIDKDRIYVIGGASVYAAFLPHTDTVFVTKIDAAFGADAFFPDLDEDPAFTCVSESESITESGISYRFCEYRSVAAHGSIKS
ncbi:MAG: dihydrofolate reductase [Clostridiales Family XIII bacterium]|jgi:dihydrofolate reductase|nr:dihydrofolate reductase [Clostridiales Family XIII bacterium]